MLQSRHTRNMLYVMIVAVLIVACSPSGSATVAAASETPTNTQETVVTEETIEAAVVEETTEATEPTNETAPTAVDTEAPVVVETVEQADTSAENAASAARLLAWVAPAAAPGQQGASAAGEVVLFNPDGTSETVLTLENGTTRVVSCGSEPTSPDGSVYALFVTATAGGNELGTLYMQRGASPTLEVAATELNPIACMGFGTFEWSADGSRYGYLDYPASILNATTPVARLRIFNTADLSEITEFENVVAFDMSDTGAAFISFFTNDRDLATEVGIFSWDGTADREVATLRSEENCFYTDANLETVADGRIVAQMGYRCSSGDTSTQWQLHIIDPENRTAEMVANASAAGRFFRISANNTLFSSPDGSTIYFTTPDGVTNQTIGLNAYALAGGNEPVSLFANFGIMPSVSDLPYDANNATAQMSPDGQWIAIVRNTGNNEATLNVFDLNDSSLPPITVEAGDRGDTISWMAFSADSSTLYFVAGSDQGGDNALFQLDLATGSEFRVDRGRYAQGALTPDASQIAIMNWDLFADDEPPFLTLEFIDLDTTAATVVYEGGEVVDGELTNQSFAYPLAWRSE